MYKKTFFTAIILLSSIGAMPAQGTDAGGGLSLRIMTYNVHNFIGMDKVRDYGRIAGVINAAAPDVVAIQEADSATVRSNGDYTLWEAARLTGMIPTYAPAIDFQGGKYGVGILSKEKPVSVRRIPLPGKEERRVLLIAEFDRYIVACTHLSLTKDDRLASAGIIMDAVRGAVKPLFLAGDMNCTPDTPPQVALRQEFITMSDTGQCTFPVVNPDRCIDYIYQYRNGWDCTAVRQVVTDEKVASDHLPVHVDIIINNKRP
jgi:endonuclease/exonuclease/phosphatase family metal-dependent hydrolase